jgi:lipopolysaccharide transport protein LptA
MSPQALRASGIVALGLLVAGPATSQEASQSTYEAACESLSGNARSDETVCVGVRISDGMNDISAGLAATNKFDFDGSLWRLSDDVRLSFNSTEILADDALFEFEQDELVRAELNGSPVVMSDYIEEGDKTVSGMAGSVSYDNRSGTLRLVGQVTLTVGENEFMGCDWIYNFNDKSYRAGTTDDCDGVTIVLSPPEAKDDPQVQPETL